MVRWLPILLLGIAPPRDTGHDLIDSEADVTTTAYPSGAPVHYGTDPGVRATLTTDRQDTGRVAGEPLPAAELNRIVGDALDWCGYLSGHFPADDELTIGRINIDPTAGSNYGDLYGSGSGLTLSTVLAWDLNLTSIGGAVNVEATLGDVSITTGDDLLLSIGDDISGTIGGVVSLTVTGGTWSIGDATETAGTRLYGADRDYTVLVDHPTIVSGADLTPSYTTTEPGPTRTSGGAATKIYETIVDLGDVTGATIEARFLDAYVTTTDTGTSDVTIEFIERAFSGTTVTETVIASVSTGANGWAAETDGPLGATLDTDHQHVIRVTAAYGGAATMGWGRISLSLTKDRVE